MKELILILAFLPIVAFSQNQLSEDEKKSGWILLFDGKSTDQWKSYNKPTFPEKGWVIEDGALHFQKQSKGGDIITKEKFSNFELALEWKIDTAGNSGIFYFIQEVEGQPVYKSALEMQILDNVKHPDAKRGINKNRQAGSLYDMIPAMPQNAKPALEWNAIIIIVKDRHVEHWLNGEKVVEFDLDNLNWTNMVKNSKFFDWPGVLNVAKEGHIGLQDHNDNVWFRNIKIRKL